MYAKKYSVCAYAIFFSLTVHVDDFREQKEEGESIFSNLVTERHYSRKESL